MKYLIVIATLVVSCMAAPTQTSTGTLDRPSPINPSVLIETKPNDKIIPIKDEKPTEVKKPFVPTVVPAVEGHHDGKQDHKPHHENHPPHTSKDSEHDHKVSSENSATVQKRSRRDVQTSQPQNDKAPLGFQKPQTLPATIPNDEHKAVEHNAPAKLQNDKGPLGFQKPQTLPAIITNNEHKVHDHINPAKPQNDKGPLGFQKPQTLPAIIPNNEHKVPEHNAPAVKPPAFPVHSLENKHHKRNVHTPLITEKNPTEESPKNLENLNEKKEEEKKEEHKTVSIPQNVQVEDLSESKPINHKHTLSAQHHGHDFHPQVQHPHSEDKKPITLGEVQQKPVVPSVAPAASDIKENPVIRKKPVPVAELFSRHHDD